MNLKSLAGALVVMAALALPGAASAQECGKLFDGLAPSDASTQSRDNIKIDAHADEGGYVATFTAPNGQNLGTLRISPDGEVSRDLADGVVVDNLSVERTKELTEAPVCSKEASKNATAQLFGIRIKITVTICVHFLWWTKCWTSTFYI